MRWLTVLSLALVATVAQSDGGVFTREILEEPTIPRQRALVGYRDGTETMVVESSVRGDAGDYGWLVPVPDPAPKVEAASPGLLDTLESQLQPTIIRLHRSLVFPVFVAVGGAFMLSIVALFAKRRPIEARDYMMASVMMALLVVIGGKALERATTKSTESAGGMAGGLEWESVGAYEFARVNTATASDPVAWLESEGLAARGAEPTIRQYLAEGWTFVALRFKKETGQNESPHPIKLTFKTQRPVYPMRLTAHSTQDLALDLYTVGTGVPKPEGLELLVARQIGWGDRWTPVGHPEFRAIASEGDVVCRFRARLQGDDLDRDISLPFTSDRQEVLKKFYSIESAWNRIAHGSLLLFGLTSWLAGLIVTVSDRKRRTVLVAVLMPLVLTAVYGLVQRTTMPVTESRQEDDTLLWHSSYEAVESLDTDKEWSSQDEIWKAMRESPYEFSQRDAPGGTIIREEEGAFVVQALDEHANVSYEVRLKRAD